MTNVEIMNNVLEGVLNTPEWDSLQLHDQGLNAAEEAIAAVLEEVKPHIPKALFTKLEDAITGATLPRDDLAVMYGMRVGIAIMDILARPTDLSRENQERAAV